MRSPQPSHVEIALDHGIQVYSCARGALYRTFLAQVEPPLLKAVMQRCRGNQSRAADLLGINRVTLRKKLVAHRISPRGPWA